MTKINDLIDDLNIFRMVIEGSLSNWRGSFDVLPADEPNPKYLFGNVPNAQKFCKTIRSNPQGKELCVECDIRNAQIALKKERPINYICHAGLLDVAVPIIIDNNPIGTIFYGQCRSWDKDDEKLGKKRTIATAKSLGFNPLKMLYLRRITKKVKKLEVENVQNKLLQVSNYIASNGFEKKQLLNIKTETMREGKLIQSIIDELAGIVQIDEYWNNVENVLKKICKIIGAEFSAFFVSDRDSENEFYLKALANLNFKDFKKVYPKNKSIFNKITSERKPIVTNFNEFHQGTFCSDLAKTIKVLPTKVAMIPFELSGNQNAIMLFFLHEQRDLEDSLPIKREIEILLQVAPQLASAYQNCKLLTRQNELNEERNLFLEDVGHQLLAPLNGLQADSDRLLRYYSKWDEERIKNQISAIRGISRWSARLTRNLVWVTNTGDHKLRGKKSANLTGLLIGCAIDVQGLAAYKKIRVVVKNETTDLIPNIFVDRNRFEQAIVNLLDNAVKYSEKYTSIKIHAEKINNKCAIYIENYGIPINEIDLEKIFERRGRTKDAEERIPGGTGIGLPVAREILRLHGGDITTNASEFIEYMNAHKVIFRIII